MATDKKHIAVYLDKAVEDALTEFCAANGMESKKGPMYSAAVNKALAQFFGIESTTLDNIPDDLPNSIPSNTPSNTLDNIPDDLPNSIPSNTPSNTLDNIPGNIPVSADTQLVQRLAELETQLSERLGEIEGRLGKLRA
jgi:hypothetical protein